MFDRLLYWLCYPVLIRRLFDHVIDAQFPGLYTGLPDDPTVYRFLGYGGGKVLLGDEDKLFVILPLRRLERLDQDEYIAVLKYVDQWLRSELGQTVIAERDKWRSAPHGYDATLVDNASGERLRVYRSDVLFDRYCAGIGNRLMFGIDLSEGLCRYFMPTDVRVLVHGELVFD